MDFITTRIKLDVSEKLVLNRFSLLTLDSELGLLLVLLQFLNRK